MDDLIEALQIFAKYGNPQFPTSCRGTSLYVNISYDAVSLPDRERLSALGFDYEEYGDGFSSTRYRSC